MKAPKGIKKYATGGIVYQEDPKKKKVVTTEGVNTPNPNFPTAAEQMAAKGLINPTTADILKRTNSRINSGGITTGNRAVLGIQNAGGLQQDTKQLIPNDLGTFDPNTGIQYGFDGKVIQAKASGGKIMKAPKGIKGYLTGGEITPEEQNQGVYIRNGVKYNQAGVPVMENPDMSNGYNQPTTTSANNSLNTGGTEFKTQGDAPLTQKLDADGQAEKKMPSENEMKARGAANTAGQALGAYGQGYYATNVGETKGENIRAGVISAVSKMGGIGGAIGGLAAIGDQIGKPIKSKSEKVDSSGNIINEQKAKQNAIGGGLLSPSKALAYRYDSGNWGDISGKQYLDYIEKPYKAQIEEEKKAAEKSALSEALNARSEGKVGYNATNMYKPHEFAQGGKIVGKGTAKSDDINAKIKGNSFVVPEENSEVAETIRKVVLKKAPSVKAKLNQKGGENVKLSNGEHLFTPNEVSKIEASGIDLDKLAPDADNDEYYANGGKIPVGTKVGNATWNGKNWTEGKNIYSAEGGKQFENAYYKKINDERKAYLDNIESENRRNNPNYKAPTKSATELDKLKQAPSDKLGKPTLKAPSVKKSVAKTNGITNENYVAPQDLALVEQLKTPNVTKETVNDPNLDKYNKDLKEAENRTPQGGGDKGKSWKAWSPMFGNYLGNAIETGASLAQIKLGRDALNKAGVRPVGEIDPSFQANVDRAHAQSKYGFTAEQNALINQENQNATNAARFAARNYSGGSGGNAFNMERSAINEGWGRGLQAKIANTNLMLDKQQLDNQLSLQKAEMSRQLFEDKMDAFQQNQQAGALLKQTGWKNLIGATRYASALNSINQQNQLGQ